MSFVDFNYDLSQGSALRGLLDKAHLGNYPHAVSNSWPTDIDPFKIDTPDKSNFGDDSFEFLWEQDEALVFAYLSYGNVSISSYASTPDKAREELKNIGEHFPKKDEEEVADEIPVQFWAYSSRGPAQFNRDLLAPTWEEIKGNYTKTTHDALDRLLVPDFRPHQGGQLLLWHGEPGTGKTTALRALAQEWRKWAKIQYITDPERFFGDHADYMLSVMLQDEHDYDYTGKEKRDKKWRILILEDSGELLQSDAKHQTGQALSRFLNSVDGLIGQGLRVLTLVTTNEELRSWHPAVTRHGRALAQIEFNPLTTDEANAWIKDKGKKDQVAKPTPLADLYAKIEGRELIIENAKQAVGFGV